MNKTDSVGAAKGIKPIYYASGQCHMLDQRLLPTQEIWYAYQDYRDIAAAIRTMVVRGAPAIGIAAAFGAAFAARELAGRTGICFQTEFAACCSELAATRPTAVNLFWALERMQHCATADPALHPDAVAERLLEEALEIAEQDEAINRAMGLAWAGIAAGTSTCSHTLQCRGSGHRWLWHCAGRDSRRGCRGKEYPGVCG